MKHSSATADREQSSEAPGLQPLNIGTIEANQSHNVSDKW